MLILLTLSLAQAHELQETTARVELRGDHVTLSVSLDAGAWLSALSDDPRPLGVIAMTDPEAFAAIAAEAEDELAAISVRAGEAPATLRVMEPLDVEETRLALIQYTHAALTGEHGHPPRARLTLEWRLPGEARALSVRLPSSMGPSVVSFAEPRAATVPPGGAAKFVLDVPDEAPPERGGGWGLAALAGLAGVLTGWRLSV